MLNQNQLERFKKLFDEKILPATKGKEKDLFILGEKARKSIKEKEKNNL